MTSTTVQERMRNQFDAPQSGFIYRADIRDNQTKG